MKWAYSIQNKTTAAILLLGILVLIGVNNLREHRMTNKMNSVINTMYKDRLWADHLISEIQYSVLKLKNCSETHDLTPQIERIAHLNSLFAQTTLTPSEQAIFHEYQTLCKDIYLDAQFDNISISEFNQAENYLQKLNQTQITEGKILLSQMEDMVKSADLMSSFEISLLIILGIITQILVFTSKTLKKAFKPQAAQWN